VADVRAQGHVQHPEGSARQLRHGCDQAAEEAGGVWLSDQGPPGGPGGGIPDHGRERVVDDSVILHFAARKKLLNSRDDLRKADSLT